jgi:hypothetical protein
VGKETVLIARPATERFHVGSLTKFNFPYVDKIEFIYSLHQCYTKICETQQQKHGSQVSIFKGEYSVCGFPHCNFILKRSDLSFSPAGPQTINGGESCRTQVYH